MYLYKYNFAHSFCFASECMRFPVCASFDNIVFIKLIVIRPVPQINKNYIYGKLNPTLNTMN